MKFKNYIEVQSGIKDSADSPGTLDQVLTSTATGVAWVDPSTISAEAATLVVIECKNTSGATITKGTPVYQTGTVGATDVIEIAPADALISAGKQPAIGLLQTTLSNNGFGKVVITGEFLNFTTDPIDGVTPTTGQKVFLKSGGGLTLTKPTGAENGIQNLGLIGKVSGGNAGSITVSSIMRTNDVPNLPTGKIWVGTATNTAESTVVHLDEGNGRMGIGTASPNAKLDVDGAGNFSGGTVISGIDTSTDVGVAISAGDYLYSNNGNHLRRLIGQQSGGSIDIGQQGTSLISNINFFPGTSGNIDFFGSGSIDMRVASTGNVGINTTSPSSSNKLEVNGQVRVVGAQMIGDSATSNVVPTGVQLHVKNTGEAKIRIEDSDLSNLAFDILVNEGDGFSIKETVGGGSGDHTRLFIQETTGNVGIGTTSPDRALEVEGNIRSNGNIRAYQNNSSAYYIEITANSSWGYLQTTSSNFYINKPIRVDTGQIGSYNEDLQLKTGATERVRISNTTGNVGIGTTSPGQKLDVRDGTITSRDSGNVNYAELDRFSGLTLKGNGAGVKYVSTPNTDALGFKTNNSEKMRIDANGTIFIGNQSTAYQTVFLDPTPGTVYGNGTIQISPLTSPGSGVAQFTTNFADRVGGGTTKHNIRVGGAAQMQTGITEGIHYVGAGVEHWGDGGTGMSFPANDTVSLRTASSDRLYINSTGNVGIGTTSPGGKLHIHQTGSGTNNSIITEDDARKIFIGRDSIKATNLSDNPAELYIQQHGGNATFGSDVSLGGNLTLTTNARYLRAEDSAGTTTRLLGINGSNTTYIGPIDAYAGGSIFYGVSANVSAQTFYTGASARMHINSTGNVGIGTTSPSSLLHVSSETSGNAIVIIESDTDNNNENDNPQLQFKQDGGNTIAKAGLTGDQGQIFGNSLGNAAYFGNDENASVQFYTNATAALTIREDGDVGIGTTSPERPLHVLNTSSQTVAIFDGGNNSASEIAFKDAATSGGTYVTIGSIGNNMSLSAGASERMRITSGGNVGIGTTSPSQKLHVAGNMRLQNQLYDSTNSTGSNGQVLTKTSGGTIWADNKGLTPITPGGITATIVGETIEIAFNQSTTSNIDYYQVWSSDDGGDYGIIGQIAPADFSTTMTVVDTTFVTGGTMSYRVYAVKAGVYSPAGTVSKAYTVSALDVTNMTVVNLNTAYYVQYEKPVSRFIDHIEIWMDSQTTQAALNRSNATLVYSGQNASYMRSVGTSSNFHQFWVEVVTS